MRHIESKPSITQLRALAAQRKSAWLHNCLSWLAGTVGASSVLILVLGVRHGHALSSAPRPNVGPGFSEATTAVFGAMLIGGAVALVSLALVGVALLHSTSRLRTLAFALPAVAFAVLLACTRYWSA